jgi:hypothetical protein
VALWRAALSIDLLGRLHHGLARPAGEGLGELGQVRQQPVDVGASQAWLSPLASRCHISGVPAAHQVCAKVRKKRWGARVTVALRHTCGPSNDRLNLTALATSFLTLRPGKAYKRF